MKNLINFLKKYNLLFTAIFFKRIFFSFYKILENIGNSFYWFVNSKEHTNFSFELSENNLDSVILFLQNNFHLEKTKIEELINDSKSVNFSKRDYKYPFSTSFADVDFKNKWDYRLLPFIIFFLTDIKYIFEFGYDQGRLPLLIYKNYEKNKFLNKNYIGIDINPRKGALVNKLPIIENICLINQSLQDYIDNENLIKFNESIVISSTHEKTSEKYLFNKLRKENIFPKIIISDEVGKNSSYKSFVENEIYSNSILIFNDKNNFLNPLYIGISIKK